MQDVIAIRTVPGRLRVANEFTANHALEFAVLDFVGEFFALREQGVGIVGGFIVVSVSMVWFLSVVFIVTSIICRSPIASVGILIAVII